MRLLLGLRGQARYLQHRLPSVIALLARARNYFDFPAVLVYRLHQGSFLCFLSLLLLFKEFFGIVDQILPILEKDVFEFTRIVLEVAEERDAFV